jgi:hypothetical protein
MQSFLQVIFLLGTTILFSFQSEPTVNPKGTSIAQRLQVPKGYQRLSNTPKSFGAFLQTYPLLPHNTPVMTYNGVISPLDANALAVLSIDVGKKDLLQCADAVMRLRAEYLYQNNRKNDIQFKFVSGFNCDYTSYQNGKRFNLKTNSWEQKSKADNSYQNFLNYLDLVYCYASTLSLEKELEKVKNNDVQVGDVFIRGGSPGHCFIVVDIAENPTTKAKVFAVAQGFMPAQQVHIVKNELGAYWFTLGTDYSATLPYGELLQQQYLRRFK